TVRLHFASLQYSAAGQQQFNVTINGTQVLTNFDIFAAAGGNYKAVAKAFSTTADSNGVITVNVIPVKGKAESSGLEVQSGGGEVLAINAGLLAGGTIAINPSTFTNQGTLQVSNGESLNVSGLSGNLGNALLSGEGSSLILAGTSYTVNQGLTATTGEVLTLNGGWTNASGSIINASEATLTLGNDGTSWTNSGTITVTASTVFLGGVFTLAELGTFQRSGGTVILNGTLDNTGTTLALNATTGSWNLWGG